jgi:uncharacterized protein (DUF433 family)
LGGIKKLLINRLRFKEKKFNFDLMSNLISRITINPDICNGKPTIRGKRITVQTILEFLAAGNSNDEILSQYPNLENDDIKACLEFASKLMNNSFSVKSVA